MTTSPFASNRRTAFPLTLCVGGAIGMLVALGLYGTKPAYVALLPLGCALVLPSLFLKTARLYWFAIYLLSLQFQITKNLNDGFSVLDALKIDYLITHFTFDISISDLALLALLAIWTNDRLTHGKPLRFPPESWLAVGYLGVAFLSTLQAASPYLGFVELFAQAKYFVAYLFAVNCLESKSALRVLTAVAVVILVAQAGMTVTRFETGYMTFFNAGDSRQDVDQVQQYLTVDRSDPDSVVRAFGTLGSPNETTRLCLMVIPFALFLCVPNPMFRMRLLFAGLTAFGILGLALTFTRVYYVTTVAQLGLAFFIMVRDRTLKREEAVLIVLLGLAAGAAVGPKLYQQFTVREDSMSVRELQNKTAMQIIRDHPFLGVGLNNAPEQLRKYSNVTYNKYDANTQFYTEPINNMFLSMATEIGVFGTLLFVAFFARAALVAWQQSRASSDPEIRFVASALFVVLCGVMVNGLMDPFDEYPVMMLLWLFAGVCLNLPNIALLHPPSDAVNGSMTATKQL
jgi:O-Antigen ligase